MTKARGSPQERSTPYMGVPKDSMWRSFPQQGARRVWVLGLVMIASSIGLWIGKVLRDLPKGARTCLQKGRQGSRIRKWHCYSGLFALLKREIRLGQHQARRLVSGVLPAYRSLIMLKLRRNY
jgi:hypothetical protein